MWFGPERPKWLGPFQHDYPDHLQGEVAADYGYDVLSLGAEPGAFSRNFELEILHSRWAMLGALGALLPGTAVDCMLLPCSLRRRCESWVGRANGFIPLEVGDVPHIAGHASAPERVPRPHEESSRSHSSP